MGFFANLFGSKVDDPILGRLEYHEDTWRGQIEWPNNAQPAGLFYTSETKPDATLRERVESIKQSAKRLERELQQAFFDVWKSSGNTLGNRYQRAESPLDLWRLLQMDGLNLDDSTQAQLIYSFRDVDLSDACFEAVLEDGKLVRVDIDY
jgi:hypothetical protein